MFTDRQVITVDSAPSTNEVASELLAIKPLPEGSLIVAGEQTAGRGQFGSHWWSEPGSSLTVSLVLYPEFLPLGNLFALNMTVALGVREFIREHVHHQTFIKWPNDIVCRGSKIAGVLIENSIAGERVRHSIIGIGVNVNQQTFPAFLPHATSLRMITGLSYELEKLLEPLAESIGTYYAMLKTDTKELKQLYHENLLGLGKKQLFSSGDQLFMAEIIAVTDDGLLELAMDNAERKTYRVKEVVFVQ